MSISFGSNTEAQRGIEKDTETRRGGEGETRRKLISLRHCFLVPLSPCFPVSGEE
jgi:hypothetical protein